MAGNHRADRAAELVRGTKLKDVDVRKRLADGGLKAIQDRLTDDSTAKLIDPASRRVRQSFEQQVDEPQRQAYGKIANARSRRMAPAFIPMRPSRCAWLSVSQGIYGSWSEDPLGYQAGRHIRARCGARQQRTVRAAENLERAEGAAQSLNAV